MKKTRKKKLSRNATRIILAIIKTLRKIAVAFIPLLAYYIINKM